jgi:diguanylate cyclase (GGDEF)-like protein
MKLFRLPGQALVYTAGAGVTVVLLLFGLLLVQVVAQAAQLNVQSQTAAGAFSTAQAAGEAIQSDLQLARTVSQEAGLAAAIQNQADANSLLVLIRTNLSLLSANPRVNAFYFFKADASYLLGQIVDPVTGTPVPDEQPPDWYTTPTHLRAILQALLRAHRRGSLMLLSWDSAGDPYGTLDIFQPIVQPAGTAVLGELVEEVGASSIFAPYVRPSGDNGNLFLAANVIIGPDLAGFEAQGTLPVLHRQPDWDASITGGLAQVVVRQGPTGAHPDFRLHATDVEGSSVPIAGVTIDGLPVQVINYAAASTISDSTKHVLVVVMALVALLVIGVGGLMVFLNHRLEQGERESARRIQAKNEELMAANERLELMATTDALTGLPNRTVLHDRVAHALRSATRSGTRLALLLLDLDRFKDVNDTLGHYVGDMLLQEVGVRLYGALRASDTIARLGGDEFALLLPDIGEVDDALHVARKLAHVVTEPFHIEGKDLDVGISIGIAVYPEHGADVATLLRCADVAMYVAKRTHNSYTLYEAEEDEHSPDRLGLVTQLRQAVSQDALTLHYQPKVALATGNVCGVEALVRWNHPEHGLLSPDHFIPLAKNTGLIGPLTDWVLRTALQQCHDWHRAGLHLDLAINLSTYSLHDSALPGTVSALLRQYEVAPGSLTLEITESALMADPGRALDVVTRLRESGVRVAIDDFGTGYSSLGYLKRLPVHEIKLDKSFVLGLGTYADAMDVAIVRSVIAMAQALQREVVAEGVERLEALTLLRSLGCDMVQGYYLSQPLTAAELGEWLRTAPWPLPDRTLPPMSASA